MERFNKVKTIYFDFDGTIHDTMHIYGDSLRKGYRYLIDKGLVEDRIITDDEAASWLGYNAVKMWEKFVPEVEEKERFKAMEITGKNMNKMLEEGYGRLYPGAEKVLSTLKRRGYKLIYLSNCKNVYKKAILKAFDIEKYFEDTICSESYNSIPKEEIVAKIRKKYPEEQIFVGDRFHDMQAGDKNNLKTIFCNYGFGSEKEGENASIRIDSIEELLSILD